MLTLEEKQAALHTTIAMPTKADWCFGPNDTVPQKVIDEANQILCNALEFAKSQDTIWGAIGHEVYSPLADLARRYPEWNILASEACETVARFFGLNYDPAIYDYLRYHPHT